MHKKSASCLALSRQQGGQIADCLKTMGFDYREVSVVLPTLDIDVSGRRSTHDADRVLVGTTFSGQSGRALGWIPGFHAVNLPDAGSFLVAGPVGIALEQPIAGSLIGPLAAALTAMGMREVEARHYETRIISGHIFLMVRTEDEQRIEQAQEIFMGAGMLDISVSGRAFCARTFSTPRAFAEVRGLSLCASHS